MAVQKAENTHRGVFFLRLIAFYRKQGADNCHKRIENMCGYLL